MAPASLLALFVLCSGLAIGPLAAANTTDIAATSAGTLDQATGTVTPPRQDRHVTVTLHHAP